MGLVEPRRLVPANVYNRHDSDSVDAGMIASSAIRSTISNSAGMIGRKGGKSLASKGARTGLGTAAKFVGKGVLRGALGPIGWAWLAYDVIKFGYDMYQQHAADNKKLNKLRMASYGYRNSNKDRVQTILALEGELVNT